MHHTKINSPNIRDTAANNPHLHRDDETYKKWVPVFYVPERDNKVPKNV